MKRILCCLSLLVLLPTAALATVLVSAVKEAAPINGLDVYDIHITGYADVDDLAKNVVQGLEATFTAVNGTIQFDGNTPSQIRTSTTNLLAGRGVSSWVNFDATVGATFKRIGPAAANSLYGLWFTTAASLKLRPVDVTVGAKDDGIDQTLLAKVFVSAGGGFQLVGSTGTAESRYVMPLLVNVNTGGQILPIDVSISAPSGTTLQPGAVLSISNADKSVIDLRDTAIIISQLTSDRGHFYASAFSLFTPLFFSNHNLVIAGQTLTSEITFAAKDDKDSLGVLNGATAKGLLTITVQFGPQGTGNGAGVYMYPLSTVVSGFAGDAKVDVAPGESYAGLHGISGLANDGNQFHLPSTAMILGGSNLHTSAAPLQMNWSLRSTNEQERSATSPSPLPEFATALTSDKVNVTGIDGDIFVLQMTYSQSELRGNEAQLANIGHLFLAGFDGSRWVNAIDLNHGQNVGIGNVHGAWNGQMELGAWGVDTDANVVWAVLDHDGLFASVPEPTAVLLALVGLVGFCSVIVRRRQA